MFYLNEPFSTEYRQCRQYFLSGLQQLPDLPTSLQSWPLPKYDELACDAAFIGGPEADKVLVIISGTHGVEGFCGSAIQRFLLSNLVREPSSDRQPFSDQKQGSHKEPSSGKETSPNRRLPAATLGLPEDLALLMIHGLNPWGMEWARRCDQEGIDVNRNFIDFSSLPAAPDHYQSVLDLLTITEKSTRRETMQTLTAKWGQQRFDEVFSGGQYHTPWAPFYGGDHASFSRQVIDEAIETWSLNQRQLVVLDLHTGLGPWAYGELISDHPAGSRANAFAQRLFGPAVAITDEGGSFSVAKRGLLDYRWHQLMQNAGCYLTLEFGTYGTDALFNCVLDDHLFWRDRQPARITEADYAAQRSAMLRHFCPDDSLWQQAALFKAWQVVQRVFGFYS